MPRCQAVLPCAALFVLFSDFLKGGDSLSDLDSLDMAPFKQMISAPVNSPIVSTQKPVHWVFLPAGGNDSQMPMQVFQTSASFKPEKRQPLKVYLSKRKTESVETWFPPKEEKTKTEKANGLKNPCREERRRSARQKKAKKKCSCC